MKNKKTLQDFVNQATANVREDRATTKTLLMSLMKYMQSSEDRHREVGLVAAKYLETLQRSNEQLVKLAILMQKKESFPSAISDEEKNDLFDLITEKKDDKV